MSQLNQVPRRQSMAEFSHFGFLVDMGHGHLPCGCALNWSGRQTLSSRWIDVFSLGVCLSSVCHLTNIWWPKVYWGIRSKYCLGQIFRACAHLLYATFHSSFMLGPTPSNSFHLPQSFCGRSFAQVIRGFASPVPLWMDSIPMVVSS